MAQELPENFDILCTHPMFGPESGKDSWAGLTFQYEKVRDHGAQRMGNSAMTSEERMNAFLRVWEDEVRPLPRRTALHTSTAHNRK
jgi:arogenate dehydrogenase (NADP+)